MAGPKGQQLALKLSGLITDPNTFSEVPEGLTLARASNVVLDKDSIMSSRRGFAQYGVPTATPTAQITSMFDFKDTIIVADVLGNLSYDANNNGSTWTQYTGTFLPPSGVSNDRINSFQANKNLFFTTSEGVFKLEAPTATPRQAGVSAGLGGSGVTTGAAGFMATSTNVAYRIVWGYRDLNENLVLGAPSDRIVVPNTSGGERNVAVTFFIPQDINSTYFYQIYRSSGSASLNDQPDDELQLVFEGSPSPAQFTAGIVVVTDQTVDALRGALIYTAPSLTTLGAAGANFQPPFCTAVCTFNNHSFFGNTRNKHTLTLTVIAAGGSQGIQVGDTITVTDGVTAFTLTGAVAEDAGAGQYLAQTALTPAQNIDITARSIVSVMNTFAANTMVAAYYTSGFEELPGRIELERITLNVNPFTVNTSRTTAWRPVLTTTGSTYNNTSRNEVRQNRVFYSKMQEYEAVPIVNFFDIGSPEEPIRALVPLRDGVIVLKTDGVYRISGNDRASFAVNPIDTTVSILAPNSVAVLSNKVFFFSEQGIVAVSDNAAEIVSRPIETELLQYSSSVYPNFGEVTFAVGYESDRKYILYTVTTPSDTYGTQAYVFNTLTGDWTRWTRAASVGIVKQQDDKLYLGGLNIQGTGNQVYKERKSYNLSDFADEQFTVTVVSALGDLVTVDDTGLLETGYTLQQPVGSSTIVAIVDSTTIRVKNVLIWNAGAATAYRPIFVAFETNQFDAGQPGIMKHWADCSVIFRATTFDEMQFGFQADTTGETRSVTLFAPPGTGGWGTYPWGTLPWGLSTASRARIRTSVPKQAMRSNWLALSGSLNSCFTDLNMAGVSLTFGQMSSRQKSGSKS